MLVRDKTGFGLQVPNYRRSWPGIEGYRGSRGNAFILTSMRPSHNRKTRRSATSDAKQTKLRVIGGDMRGRTIHYHGASFTRPMKDNIRENLFNILGRAARGAICFDLFAGTGALAFESLSRGAKSVVMVEQNRNAVRFIQQTAESLDVESRIRVITGDTFRLAGQLLAPPEDDTPWIVFLCPPYVLWHDSLDDLNRIIQTTLDNAPPGSVLVAETEKSFAADRLPPGDWDLREYGGTRLAFIEPAMRCGLNL
jgi:16S rRNA (guanine966-N2)-methyltransferase